jgi:trehalose-6-phosphate synthase
MTGDCDLFTEVKNLLTLSLIFIAGILGSDLVGFQCDDYVLNFIGT